MIAAAWHARAIAAAWLARATAAVLVAAAFGLAGPAGAQETAPPDSVTPPVQQSEPAPDGVTQPLEQTEPAPADTSAPVPPTRARIARAALGRDVQRFEVGAAAVDGPFDAIGTFAYHRYVRTGGPFENWIHVELSGATTNYLDEGAASAAFLVRPLIFIRREGFIRPIFEVGPAGHLVVQVAEVQDFGETVFHAHAYLKTHAFAGFDLRLGGGWGLVVRGRFTAPADRPLDYAQIAVFFR